ncbi:MAG: TRAP-type mannitol/chloroaromatic compound transport system permease large subunit [Cellvibrionaceae bacterium]|jgi:TRAP-type mannitol/chloroaromatic compound transport system permease large subunit
MTGFEWLAVVMFVLFLILILSGYPVAFSFAGTAIAFGAIGLALGAFPFARLGVLQNRWFGSMSDFTLLAVPFFVFMGAVFEKSGLAEQLLTTIGQAMGPLRGGLALAVVLVGTLLAAATGVVAATVIVMGILSLPIMLKYGYDHQLATGIIVASGTMAQLLPPSLVLVVLSDQIGVSVGDLFVGALIPGLMLSSFYALYVIYVAYRYPEKAPALPLEARDLTGLQLTAKMIIAVIPPLALIGAVLGSIFAGLATPTEAGAVGAFGALFLALLNKLNLGWSFVFMALIIVGLLGWLPWWSIAILFVGIAWLLKDSAELPGRLEWGALFGIMRKMIWQASRSTANITALVLMILFCSTFFGLIFDQLGGQRWVTNILVNLPGGFWGFIIVANIAVFLLGINLEFLEISFIVMPLFVPSMALLNFTNNQVVWFAVMMAINLNMAFISPPVGFSLFYLQSVAPPEVETKDIHLGALPFMVLQGVALIVVMVFPTTVTWLVDRAG